MWSSLWVCLGLPGFSGFSGFSGFLPQQIFCHGDRFHPSAILNSLSVPKIHSFPSCNCPSGSVRLSRGTGPCSGLVEVYQNGQWDPVCKSHFGLEEAKEVCEELNCGSPKEDSNSFNYSSVVSNTSRCAGENVSTCSVQETPEMCEGVSLSCAGKSSKVVQVQSLKYPLSFDFKWDSGFSTAQCEQLLTNMK